MDDGAATLALSIGARVKQERQVRKWTLDELAEAAGVSRRSLVNVEQGSANPSIGTLLRISDALGVGLSALVEQPRTEQVRITRSGAGVTLWSSGSGGRATLVAGTEPPDVVELWAWTLGPGDRYDSEAHVAGTRELALVQRGTVTLEAGDRSEELGVGDAASFCGDVPHAYVNVGSKPAHFTLAVFEPGVGPRPRQESSHA